MRTAHKVLVIDDDEVVGRSFDRVLSEKGYAVSTALDGEEALKKCGGEDKHAHTRGSSLIVRRRSKSFKIQIWGFGGADAQA